MLKMGIPVGAGTDGTRVASYHPWTCLWWMVTGKTVGGTVLHDAEDCMSREEALKLYTQGSAWFSSEDNRKGTLSVGSFADLAVLSEDYFAVEPDDIRCIESLLTIVGGRSVYAARTSPSLIQRCRPSVPIGHPYHSTVGTTTARLARLRVSTLPSWLRTDAYGRPRAVAGHRTLNRKKLEHFSRLLTQAARRNNGARLQA